MSESRTEITLLVDEPLLPLPNLAARGGVICCFCAALSLLFGVVVGFTGGGWLGGLRGFLFFLAFSVGITVLVVLLLWPLSRWTRLCMDETSVWFHMPLVKPRGLRWEDIRTAAIVQPKHLPSFAMILVSVREPEVALTAWRALWLSAERGKELRFFITPARCAAIEKQLGKPLPTVKL